MTEEEKQKLPEKFRARWQHLSERSKDEARNAGHNGGIASGESRRERKAIQEVCREIDEAMLDSQSIKDVAKQLGMPEEWVAQMTHRTAKAFSVNKQILLKGDVKAWVEWLKVAGDYTETVNVNDNRMPRDDEDVVYQRKRNED